MYYMAAKLETEKEIELSKFHFELKSIKEKTLIFFNFKLYFIALYYNGVLSWKN